jgi:hypothetical protein
MDHQVVAGRQHVAAHGAAHVAEADEADVHAALQVRGGLARAAQAGRA